jgi:hypothetical protein
LTGSSSSGSLPPTRLAISQMTSQASVIDAPPTDRGFDPVLYADGVGCRPGAHAPARTGRLLPPGLRPRSTHDPFALGAQR